MTIKFLKQWGQEPRDAAGRGTMQRFLDGGGRVTRTGCSVGLAQFCFTLPTPAEAVKFAAALNKLRRPLHLIKKDLDEDWARRVKERDNNVCALCGVQGDKVKAGGTKDVLTAHHWLKTKSKARMARWSRACGVTVHFAEHIHTLHENPCWIDLDAIWDVVAKHEGLDGIASAVRLSAVEGTEARVRELWAQRCGGDE
jgi:hypothetical protein